MIDRKSWVPLLVDKPIIQVILNFKFLFGVNGLIVSQMFGSFAIITELSLVDKIFKADYIPARSAALLTDKVYLDSLTHLFTPP